MCRIIKSAVILLIALMNIGAVATAFADSATPLPGAIFTTDDGCLQVNGNVWYENKQAVYLNGGPAKKGDATGLPDGAYFVRVIVPGLGSNTPEVLGTSGSNQPIIVVGGHFAQCYRLWDIVKYLNGNQGYDDTSNPGGEYQVEVSTVDFTDPAWSASNEKSDNFKVRKGTPTTLPGIDIELDCPSSVWVGQTITYKMRAHNTGNVPLFNVTISGTVNDVPYGPLPDTNGVTLLPGAYSDWMEYTITATSAGDYENIATAQGVYDATVDPPAVVVKSGSCSPKAFELTVTKTAKTTLDRTYTWKIEKSVDPTAVEVVRGATVSLAYKVTTSVTSEDSNFVLDGTITISNPAPFAATLSSIVDPLVTPTCPGYTVPAATDAGPGTLVCSYSKTFTAIPETTSNTVTVTVEDGDHDPTNDPPFGDVVSFSFNPADKVNPIDDKVTATDVAVCPAGFTCSDRPAPWDYQYTGGVKTYTVSVTNNSFGCGGETTLKNTVTLSGGSTASDSKSVTLSNNDCWVEVLKYYDTNANGARDEGECPISGWNFSLGTVSGVTGSNGVVRFDAPYGSTVTVCETLPASWVAVSPGTCAPPTTLTGDLSLSFGNLKLGAGGGRTLGYWSNKNGQATMTTGGMTGELAMLTVLNLRTPKGADFDPTSYTAFRNWILNATATNMAYMLSAQLAAMELNVYNGSVAGTSLIYAPGTNNANPFGFATVSAVMIEANQELGLHGYTVSDSADRSYQEALKNALDRANNNLNFVQTYTCSQ